MRQVVFASLTRNSVRARSVFRRLVTLDDPALCSPLGCRFVFLLTTYVQSPNGKNVKLIYESL